MSKPPFLFNEYKLSMWAYRYCLDIEDDPEIRNLITDSFTSLHYCKFIKDRKEISKNITQQPYIDWYNKLIEERKNNSFKKGRNYD